MMFVKCLLLIAIFWRSICSWSMKNSVGASLQNFALSGNAYYFSNVFYYDFSVILLRLPPFKSEPPISLTELKKD